jgi:hypothetical protein
LETIGDRKRIPFKYSLTSLTGELARSIRRSATFSHEDAAPAARVNKNAAPPFSSDGVGGIGKTQWT